MADQPADSTRGEPMVEGAVPLWKTCSLCNYDRHRCLGCGIGVPHGTIACDECGERWGDWLLTLICCGREDGFQVCATSDDAREFRAAYLDAHGHERVAILSKLDQPARVGFHKVSP